MKFYKCEICGKIVAMVKETPVDTMCCGVAMRELVLGIMYDHLVTHDFIIP